MMQIPGETDKWEELVNLMSRTTLTKEKEEKKNDENNQHFRFRSNVYSSLLFFSHLLRGLIERTVTAEVLLFQKRREKKASRSENKPYLFRIKSCRNPSGYFLMFSCSLST
jgi:hypothetical protein